MEIARPCLILLSFFAVACGGVAPSSAPIIDISVSPPMSNGWLGMPQAAQAARGAPSPALAQPGNSASPNVSGGCAPNATRESIGGIWRKGGVASNSNRQPKLWPASIRCASKRLCDVSNARRC